MHKFGLIAKDIENSVTPVVYASYAEQKGIRISFEIFNIEEEELPAKLDECRRNLNGFNITMPYKQKALLYMDEIAESAAYCGSVNTVEVRNGKLIAHNTDGWGLILALKRKGIEVREKNIVMLGAGGVASSIAYNLFVNKAKHVSIVNIDLPMAKALAEKYPEQFEADYFDYETLAARCLGADLFINASVMGQLGYDEFSSFSFLDGLKKGAAVFDVNYSNPAAKLVSEARKRGFSAYNGKSMTACQGVRAFALWTGLTPTEEELSNTLKTLKIEE